MGFLSVGVEESPKQLGHKVGILRLHVGGISSGNLGGKEAERVKDLG